MNSPLADRQIINSLERDALRAEASRLAAGGRGLPAVMAALQADLGQSHHPTGYAVCHGRR